MVPLQVSDHGWTTLARRYSREARLPAPYHGGARKPRPQRPRNGLSAVPSGGIRTPAGANRQALSRNPISAISALRTQHNSIERGICSPVLRTQGRHSRDGEAPSVRLPDCVTDCRPACPPLLALAGEHLEHHGVN